MAKEITVAKKADLLSVAITNRVRGIRQYLDHLEKLEPKLKMTDAERDMYQLCILSIRQDCAALAAEETE